MRCFIGLPPSPDLTRACEAARESFLDADPSWVGEKWVPSRNLHVTLVFLGEVDETAIGSWSPGVAAAVARSGPLVLRDPVLACTPRPRRASMIWVRLADEDGACAALACDIEAACGIAQKRPNRRVLSAHVTLARARRPRVVDPGAVDAADHVLRLSEATLSDPPVTLYRSWLTPTGPSYDEIAAWHVGGS